MKTSNSTTRTLVQALAALAAGMAFATPPATAGDGTFGPGQEVGAGHPASVAVGHFNSDARPDLAIVDYTGKTVTVRVGSPSGYSEMPSVPAGNAPEVVVAADFNGDGFDDLALSDAQSRQAKIRLSAGDGTFTNGPDLDVGRGQSSLVAGDFNGDNKEDLALSSRENATRYVTVHLGKGNGSFEPAGVTTVPAVPLAVGDFNSDEREDLVYGASNTTLGKMGGVLLGAGNGHLVAGGDIALPGPAFQRKAWAVGDFNSDGNLDVAAAVAPQDVVSIRMGAGDGTFGGGRDVPAGDGPSMVAVGDANSDGRDDLVVSNGNDDSVSLHLGDGAGGFARGTSVGVGDEPRDVVLADLDIDGNDDLATANQAGSSVSVRPGLGAPALAGNLLVNGGFEGGGATGVLTSQPPIPGWERTGGITFARYGIAAHLFFPSRLSSPRYGGGGSFLWGGSSATASGLTQVTQTADVSASAAAIDDGRATANLSAYLGGALKVPDTMSVQADFLDGDGATTGGFGLPAVTIADRKALTTFVRRAGSAPVPGGTRRIRVTLSSVDADQSYSSATADNVKLTLDVTPPSGAEPGGGGDGAGPVIGSVRLAPARFAVSQRATARSAARRGTTIGYTLSEPAAVTLRFQRKRGRRWVPAGTLRRAGLAGANRVAFSGRVGRRPLRRGAYRLIVSAVDPAGNRSSAKPKRFRVVR